ncbi:MAG TPA: ABC transporter ATP-binding protein [Ramlibacter sp.]|nr:ABC transporter ATP-binding protein [Ramlibacter sp.]
MAHPQGIASACPPPLLEIEKVSVRFGGVQALTDVNLAVHAGEICGLIGPNGAGKTTLFNCITRMCDVSAGTVQLEGRRIDKLPTHRIIAAGVARTFQNLGVYPRMTVLENVMLGAHHACGQSVARAWLRPGASGRSERVLADSCRAILADLGLAQFADAPASSLPYPTLKRVEIARALAARPRLLLLDEPAGGLTHSEVTEFGELIQRIRRTHNLAVLLVEHHMGLVMNLCSRLVVLHLGKNLTQGTPAEVRSDPAVVAAYLGKVI